MISCTRLQQDCTHALLSVTRACARLRSERMFHSIKREQVRISISCMFFSSTGTLVRPALPQRLWDCAGAPPRTPGSTPQPPCATPRPLTPLPAKAALPTTSSNRAAAGDRIAAIRSPRQPSATTTRGAAGRGRLAASCGRSAASPAAGGGCAAAAPAVEAALVPAASGRSAGVMEGYAVS